MSEVFIKIFNLAVTAGWFVLALLILRPLMKKTPKWISCLLWGIVGLRLCIPFKLESIFSLIPSAEPIPQNITMAPAPEINSGIGVMNEIVNPVISETLAPQVGASVNPMQIVIGVASYIWVIGIALMLCYGAISYILLRRKVRVSLKGEENVYFCDEVDSPFILGVILPRIYVPSAMSGEALGHVLAHERAHIRRLDHIWKPLGFMLLAIYWFNPLFWVAYALLCRDIEAACDEKVIKQMDAEAKKDYSRTLLDCSLHRRRIMACPLAFGEVGVKARVKSILNYKKPAFWVIIAALIVTLVLSVCFLTNPTSNVRELLEPGSKWVYDDGSWVSFSVDSAIEMSGLIQTGSDIITVKINCHKEGNSVFAEFFAESVSHIQSYDDYVAGVTDPDIPVEGQLLLSGVFKDRGGKVVFHVKEDAIGLGQKKIVFELMNASGNRQVTIPNSLSYVNVLDCGSTERGAKISFVQAQIDDGEVKFTLKWKNRTFKTQIYGNPFEVYRYEGDELVPLEFIGYWEMYAIGVPAFTMSYPTFNVTEHFDISEPGKYRLVAGAAWIDFEVTLPPSGENMQMIIPVENNIYWCVTGVSSEVEGIDVALSDFKVENGDITVTLKWVNHNDKSHMVGPSFEVSRMEGGEYLPLDHKSVWFYNSLEVAWNSTTTCSYAITDHYDVSEGGYYRLNVNGAVVYFRVFELSEEYLNLDASNGLDVYFWQMSENGYMFTLYPHGEEMDKHFFAAKESFDIFEMRTILSTYDIDRDEVYIIPYHNMLSSYGGGYWDKWSAIEDVTPYRNMYLAIVNDMLLGENPRSVYPSVYESEWFDVDGDGVRECNKVCLGIVDGRFMFSYVISKDGKTAEYFENFYDTEPMSLEFVESEDGVVRLHGKNESGNLIVYDISVENGRIVLTPSTNLKPSIDEKIDFSEFDFSLINTVVITDGSSGEKIEIRNLNDISEILDLIEKIEGVDPVSNRGYSGFRYYVCMLYDYQKICDFAIYSDKTGGACLMYGYFESVGKFDYCARYKLTDPAYDELVSAIEKYCK